MTDFRVVVLPAPLRPEQRHQLAAPISKSTPCRMCDSPYQACRPSTFRQRLSHGRSRHRPRSPADSSTPSRRPSASTSPRASTVIVSRQVGDDAHIVLDHQHGAVLGDLADQRGDALDVLLAQPGHRLVEQHHLGIERERGGDLERALAAIGQLDRLRLGEGRRGRPPRPARARARSAPSSTLSERQKWNELPQLALQGHAHVLAHREVGKYRRDLERAHQPHARDRRRRTSR